jgi:hypothetical protein
MTRYPLYWRLRRPQSRSGLVAENLAPTGIRFPDRPARSKSLYQLSYRGPRSRPSMEVKSRGYVTLCSGSYFKSEEEKFWGKLIWKRLLQNSHKTILTASSESSQSAHFCVNTRSRVLTGTFHYTATNIEYFSHACVGSMQQYLALCQHVDTAWSLSHVESACP